MLHNANHNCCNVGETAQSVAQKSGVEEKVSHAGHPGLRRSRHTSVVWRIIPFREPTFKGFLKLSEKIADVAKNTVNFLFSI